MLTCHRFLRTDDCRKLLEIREVVERKYSYQISVPRNRVSHFNSSVGKWHQAVPARHHNRPDTKPRVWKDPSLYEHSTPSRKYSNGRRSFSMMKELQPHLERGYVSPSEAQPIEVFETIVLPDTDTSVARASMTALDTLTSGDLTAVAESDLPEPDESIYTNEEGSKVATSEVGPQMESIAPENAVDGLPLVRELEVDTSVASDVPNDEVSKSDSVHLAFDVLQTSILSHETDMLVPQKRNPEQHDLAHKMCAPLAPDSAATVVDAPRVEEAKVQPGSAEAESLECMIEKSEAKLPIVTSPCVTSPPDSPCAQSGHDDEHSQITAEETRLEKQDGVAEVMPHSPAFAHIYTDDVKAPTIATTQVLNEPKKATTIDTWVHPIARQKKLEKEQKAAAKLQKKKSKKATPIQRVTSSLQRNEVSQHLADDKADKNVNKLAVIDTVPTTVVEEPNLSHPVAAPLILSKTTVVSMLPETLVNGAEMLAMSKTRHDKQQQQVTQDTNEVKDVRAETNTTRSEQNKKFGTASKKKKASATLPIDEIPQEANLDAAFATNQVSIASGRPNSIQEDDVMAPPRKPYELNASGPSAPPDEKVTQAAHRTAGNHSRTVSTASHISDDHPPPPRVPQNTPLQKAKYSTTPDLERMLGNGPPVSLTANVSGTKWPSMLSATDEEDHPFKNNNGILEHEEPSDAAKVMKEVLPPDELILPNVIASTGSVVAGDENTDVAIKKTKKKNKKKKSKTKKASEDEIHATE